MPVASFPLKDVVELARIVREQAAEKGCNPNMDQIFDGSLYPNGEPLDEKGRTEKQAEAEGGFFWPSAKQITGEVKPTLTLVGDSGLYLLGNQISDEPASKSGHLVYAKGCNPSSDDDFYDEKQRIWGGDDGSVSIPLEWVDLAVKAGKRRFSIKLLKNSIQLG